MCTRVLWNNPDRGIYCGRNMDWAEDIGTNMWALPRGQERSGQTEVNPLTWKSRYGSLILTAHDIVTTDGINEKGLSVSLLFLHETRTGPRDPNVPGLCIGMWAQWYMDLFATVAEAVEATRETPFQLRMATEPHSGEEATGTARNRTVMSVNNRLDRNMSNLRRISRIVGSAPKRHTDHRAGGP